MVTLAAFTAATIEHDLAERGSDTADPLPHHRSAIDRYGKLAETFSDHPRAAEADLLAIYHAAQIARLVTGTRRQDALDHYATRIDIHLKRWPDGSTVGQVQLWLRRPRPARRAFRPLRRRDQQHSNKSELDRQLVGSQRG